MEFNKEFDPQHGGWVDVAQTVTRVTASNAGPFTFFGTNSYIIGKQTLMVVDPGPDDVQHFKTLLKAIGSRLVSHILVTHTHADHCMIANRLKEATGAVTVGFGPHRAARPLHEGEANLLDASSDRQFVPDLVVGDGNWIENGDIRVQAIHTPGHTANHLCFALGDSPVLFSGDHVMAWATTIVAPPDGSMTDYLASIDRLRKRRETLFLPGHGGPVTRPAGFLRGLKTHRLMREAAILDQIGSGSKSIREIVEVIYRDTDRRLHGAAALTVLAHLERLIDLNLVGTDGPPTLDARYKRL